jgi:hypothetical protein
MYSFFLTEINLNEANRQSQNKAIAAKNLQNQQKKTKVNKAAPTELSLRCKQGMYIMFVFYSWLETHKDALSCPLSLGC